MPSVTALVSATVISSTLQHAHWRAGRRDRSGDAIDIVTRLKAESDVPLRSQASRSLNWAQMAAGSIDCLPRPAPADRSERMREPARETRPEYS